MKTIPNKYQVYAALPVRIQGELRKQIEINNIGFLLLTDINTEKPKIHLIPPQNYNILICKEGSTLSGIHIFGLEPNVTTGNYYENSGVKV